MSVGSVCGGPIAASLLCARRGHKHGNTAATGGVCSTIECVRRACEYSVQS